MSVAQCAQTFRESVQASYGPGRRLLRGLSVLRGNDEGGVQFFEPSGGLPNVGPEPSWKGGAFVPGQSKMHGATRMAVHAYIVSIYERLTEQHPDAYADRLVAAYQVVAEVLDRAGRRREAAALRRQLGS